MLLRKLLLIIFTTVVLSACQSSSEQVNSTAVQVVSETLDNGLFYEIHSKKENSGRIQLRLMIKSGSFSETSDQSGYAHLVEHMAFNGTQHFPKNKIIELFEKSGLTFGNDINAYTSFSETVYSLSIPKSDKKLLAQTLLYLRDILTAITFDPTELDKEKGVVENEYRLGTLNEKSYDNAILFDYIKGSEYAQRLPIGTLESIQSSTSDSLNTFYKSWYRPNNAKLLITGDIDSKSAALLIGKTFSPLEKSDNSKQQTTPDAPSLQADTQSYTSQAINFHQTDVFYELPTWPIENSKDLGEALQLDMLKGLINYRLNAANNQRETPFSDVGFVYNWLLNNKMFGNAYINYLNGQSREAVEFIAQELARIEQHGFSAAEYTQQIALFKSFQSELSNYYINKNSAQLADDVIESWRKGDSEYTLELEQQAYQMALSTTRESFNQLASELLKTPSKLTLAVPYQSTKPNLSVLDSTFSETINKPISKSEFKIEKLTLPIVKNVTARNKITRERFYSEKQITQWDLSNGVSVVLQPDHSVKNAINMSFTAPGGVNSLQEDQLVASAFLINSYLNSGLAGLSAQALNQKFNQAKADFMPLVTENQQGFTMHSVNDPKSLQLLFSMFYKAFTAAEIKENAFALEKNRIIEQQKTSLTLPTNVFLAKVLDKIFPDNNRQKQFSIKQLESVHQSDVEALYKTLFASANGFKLTIVGDFEIDQLKPVILQYIANLPTGKLHAFNKASQSLIGTASDLNDATNQEDNALVLLYAVTDTPNQSIKAPYEAELMQRIISQTITKIVREQLSLTYSPYVQVIDQPAGNDYTQVIIRLITKVEDAKQTQQVVDEIVNNLLNDGITEEQLSENKKNMKLDLVSSMGDSSNREWFLHRDHLFGYPLGSTEDASLILDSISIEEMKSSIRAYLAPQKTLRAINLPQKKVL
ncbi:M16 family metallopeptidase [Vibrio sp. RC27]